jgi:twitching motility protein PilT
VLKATARITDMIMDPDMTGMIPEAIAEGAYYGMQTFDQALLAHLQGGRIDMDEALSMATTPHDFKLMAASGGASASAMDNVEQSSVF